ncbi:hypothetical protein B8V81_3927 [Paenibacillus pasadenensis]|uniref:Uncharacterized protein n=1 Tax=Paenibacillus pasadenensis TaxID=217090 RepID=A0A2N5N564_9BACL|nr:hypothetical protein [Paenibacillus pasadenensis]PLT45496.1 hypothetical protein B8V81_3927 [Paenibacillus pasadenensis]
MSDDTKRKLRKEGAAAAGETPGIDGRQAGGAAAGELGGGLLEIRSSGAENWDLMRLPAADSLPVAASFEVAARAARLMSEELAERTLARTGQTPFEPSLQLVCEMLQDVLLGQQLLLDRLQELADSAEAGGIVEPAAIPYMSLGSIPPPAAGGGRASS